MRVDEYSRRLKFLISNEANFRSSINFRERILKYNTFTHMYALKEINASVTKYERTNVSSSGKHDMTADVIKLTVSLS